MHRLAYALLGAVLAPTAVFALLWSITYGMSTMMDVIVAMLGGTREEAGGLAAVMIVTAIAGFITGWKLR